MTSKQVRILVVMAWLCVVVNGLCLAACMYSDHLAEQAGINISEMVKGGGK
jgi:hypothetical protein